MDAARHVLFRVAGERYGLPLEAVREVVLPQPPFARVPRSSEAVCGVMNLRGRVVAVVDLASLLGLPPQRLTAPGEPRTTAPQHVLVLDRPKRALGLLVGAVIGVEAVEPPDGASGEVVRGVTGSSEGAVTVLAPETLAAQAAALFGGR